MDDLLLSTGSHAVAPRRRWLWLQAAITALLLCGGPAVWPFVFLLVGLLLAPLALLSDLIHAPWALLACVWLGASVIAWAAVATQALLRLGMSRRLALSLAALATVWAGLLWVSLAVLELTGAID